MQISDITRKCFEVVHKEIAHGKAAMKSQLKDLMRKVENFELRDEQT